eukprot:TRINITY_DN65259_c0_g1_i1.p1 TRINITY_DN65259_c0_g1~~TRINITY_DN65259_c0_g1_i1.p1  ORF type:complete len:489 (-),score=48.42 TRINITY_DN65259_c0_g1_i1:403-1869(-)
MQRGLVGSEMCIRDSINAEYMGEAEAQPWDHPAYILGVQENVISLFSYFAGEGSSAIKRISAIEGSEAKQFRCVGLYNETHFMIGCSSGTILLWDTVTSRGTKIAEKTAHSGKAVISLSAKTEGPKMLVVSVSEQGKVLFWESKGADSMLIVLKEIGISSDTIVYAEINPSADIVLATTSKKHQIYLKFGSEPKKFSYKNTSRCKLFNSTDLICYSSSKSSMAVGDITALCKGISKKLFDWKAINPGMAKLIAFELHPRMPHLWFFSSSERLVKINMLNYFQPIIFSHPSQYCTALDQLQIRSFLNEEGIITKKIGNASGDQMHIAHETKIENNFFFRAVGRNLWCCIFSSNINNSQIISKREKIFPDVLENPGISRVSVDGKLLSFRNLINQNTCIVFLPEISPIFLPEVVYSEKNLGYVLVIQAQYFCHSVSGNKADYKRDQSVRSQYPQARMQNDIPNPSQRYQANIWGPTDIVLPRQKVQFTQY